MKEGWRGKGEKSCVAGWRGGCKSSKRDHDSFQKVSTIVLAQCKGICPYLRCVI
jgi:hypothetical protein